MSERWSPPVLAQPDTGYRTSIDAWLIAGFAALTHPRFFVDLGSGCGVVAWALCQLVPAARGLAVERGSSGPLCTPKPGPSPRDRDSVRPAYLPLGRGLL